MYYSSLSLVAILTFYGIAATSDLELLGRTWDEVVKMKATCNDFDFCQMRSRLRGESLTYYSCHCEIHCVQLGTCCLDSFYVVTQQPELKPICRLVYGEKYYYMIDRCQSSDSAWNDLCQNDWNHDDDIMKMVPVTSLATSLTYKNYFCFRCHEETKEFFVWEVEVTYTYSADHDKMTDTERRAHLESNSSLKYDSGNKTWVITDESTGEFVPVILKIKKPRDVWRLVKTCTKDVISNCSSDWTDEEVIKKCNAYMAIKEVERNGTLYQYKNAHCALCNFEKLEDVTCKLPFSVPLSAAPKVPFSFHFLLDFNRPNEEKVGKIKMCDNDESVWDPYAKICRKLTCALPGRKVKNGKCVPI